MSFNWVDINCLDRDDDRETLYCAGEEYGTQKLSRYTIKIMFQWVVIDCLDRITIKRYCTVQGKRMARRIRRD